MKWKERPCAACRQGECNQMECQRWQLWFLDAWDGVNQWGAQQIRRQNTLPQDRICLDLASRIPDPCKDCPIQNWCRVPCQQRLLYWDAAMARLRRRIAP